jgi:hypothetical protein
MVYLDTSVAVSLLTPENNSKSVLTWLADSNDTLLSCDWIKTEFSSALSIKRRLGQLTNAQHKATQQEFNYFIQSGVRLAPVTREMFEFAAELVSQPGTTLRAGDALHLAAALAIGAKAMATLDSNLAKNSKKLGLQLVHFTTP